MSKQINWKDFKIKDLKPNLIPNGWDSFEPYGNEGEETKAPLEVFEKNYAPNLLLNGDFFQELKHWSILQANVSMKDGNLHVISDNNLGGTYQRISGKKDDIIYVRAVGKRISGKPRVFLADDTPSQVSFRNTGAFESLSFLHKKTRPSDETLALNLNREVGESEWKSVLAINLSKLFGKGNEPTKEWCDSNLKYYSNWEDIPEKDKPVRAWDNMAVHFTPLENGLTRIQTWGGDNRLKMRVVVPRDIDKFFSCYVENKLSKFRFTDQEWSEGSTDFVSKDEESYLIAKPHKRVVLYYLQSEKKEDNLDFIASDPIINEGNKPNPTMIVTELDDGREHVQVYGANVDTKLISKPINEFEGELYSLKTEIENLGISLDMVSTVSEEVTTINKGDNKVEHIGELEGNQIIVELGAKNG